jgi:hypothetical protein
MNPENQTLINALTAFEKTTGCPADVLAEDIRLPAGYADAEIRLCDAPPILAEIKKTLRPATLGAALAQLKRFKRPGILITDYMTTPMAEKLKEIDVPFLDTAGNVYLKTADTFIYVTGRKRPDDLNRYGNNRAFRAAGLKVIFTLLTKQGQLKATTREIAHNAGVANGTVGNILKDLEQLGFVYRSKKNGLVLQNRDRLVDNWAEAYPRELRPQLNAQRFQILHPDWWKDFTYDRWQKNQMWLAGEPAAALLTKYLYPETITVYGRPDFKKLAQVIGQPMRDEPGNFELLEPFWNFETDVLDEVHRVCPPLLIYADLLAAGDARHIDAANIIREKYLHES